MINQYRNKFNQLKIQKDLLKKELKQKNSKLLEEKKQYENLIKAQEIIQIVAQQTQNQIKIMICDIVNECLQSIPFEEKVGEFGVEFVPRRNQVEMDCFFIENGNKADPMLSQGGGVLSITSFGLLLACWSLQDRKNNCIIFDEPFKFINDPENKLNTMYYIGEMIKKISKLLDIQVIIVGNNGSFNEIADKLFLVKKVNDESIINEIE